MRPQKQCVQGPVFTFTFPGERLTPLDPPSVTPLVQAYAKGISVFGKAECSLFPTTNRYIRNSIHFPSLWL